MTHSLIEMQGVKKIFYANEVETHALSNINLSVQQGEYLSITGPSGGGKSTLLSILGLLDTPSEGTYRLLEHSVSELDHRQQSKLRNKEMGFVFQSFNLISDMTVWENVLLPLSYRRDLTKAQQQALAKSALEQVGMSHRERHYPAQLSGGQQQRVAIARAVAGKPALILADEPTGNLDTKNAQSVMDLLGELNQSGVTICMVTHDPELAQRASRSIHIIDGNIVRDTVASPATNMQHRASVAAHRE